MSVRVDPDYGVIGRSNIVDETGFHKKPSPLPSVAYV